MLGPVVDAHLPSTEWAGHLVAGINEPTSAVPLTEERLSTKVDDEWLRLAKEHGIAGPDGVFLVSLARSLPRMEVRLTSATRLSERLTGANGRPGQGEFVTMARDGSVLCGVTTEEYDVWLIVDSELLHTTPPPPPRPEDVDLAMLNFMQVNVVFAPERLEPPYRDGWVLLGFLRMTGRLVRLHGLPAQATSLPWFPAPARARAGSAPVLLTGHQAGELGSVAGVPIDDGKPAYYLEFQSAEAKSRQSRELTVLCEPRPCTGATARPHRRAGSPDIRLGGGARVRPAVSRMAEAAQARSRSRRVAASSRTASCLQKVKRTWLRPASGSS